MDKVALRMGLWNIRIGTASAVIGFGLIAVFLKVLPPELPLWYSRPWGLAQLATPLWLLIVPSLAVVATIGGGVVHQLLVRSEPVLATIVVATSLVIQLLSVLGLLRILILVL